MQPAGSHLYFICSTWPWRCCRSCASRLKQQNRRRSHRQQRRGPTLFLSTHATACQWPHRGSAAPVTTGGCAGGGGGLWGKVEGSLLYGYNWSYMLALVLQTAVEWMLNRRAGRTACNTTGSTRVFFFLSFFFLIHFCRGFTSIFSRGVRSCLNLGLPGTNTTPPPNQHFES